MVKIKSSESFSFDNCQEKNLEYIRVSSYEQKRKFSWCQMSYIEQSKCPCTTAPSIERSLIHKTYLKGSQNILIFIYFFKYKTIETHASKDLSKEGAVVPGLLLCSM